MLLVVLPEVALCLPLSETKKLTGISIKNNISKIMLRAICVI